MRNRLHNTLLTLLVSVLACSFSLTANAAPYLQKLEGAVIRDMALYDPDPNTEDDEQLILLVWTLSETIKYCDDDGELDCNNTPAYASVLHSGDLYLIRINLVNNQIVEHLKALETESGGGNSIRDNERIEMIAVDDVIYVVASTNENGVVTRVFSRENDSTQFELLQDTVVIGKNTAESSPRTVMTSVNLSQVSATQSLMTLLVDWRAENGDVSNDGEDEHTRLYQYDIDHSGNGYSFTEKFEKYSLMRSRVVDIDDVTQFVVSLPEQSVPIPTRSAEAIVDNQGNIYTFQGVEQINHGNYLINNKNFTLFPGLFAGVSVYNQDTSTDTNFRTANFEDDFTGLLDTPDWSNLRVSGIKIPSFFDTRTCAISNPEFFTFDPSKSHTCSIKFDRSSFQFSNTDNDHYHQMRTLLKVPEAGTYTFALSGANDYVRLVVNGDTGRAISHDFDDGSNPTTLTVELRQGFNSIWIEHFDTNNGSHSFVLGIYEGFTTSGARIFERATLENETYTKGSGFNNGRVAEGYGFFVPKYLNKAFDIQLDSISGGYSYSTFNDNFPQGDFATNNLKDDYDQVREGFRANLDDYFRAQLDAEPENTAQALIVKRSDDGTATALQAFKDEKPEQALFSDARLYLASRFIQTNEDISSSANQSELRTRGRGLKISALQTSSLDKIQNGPDNNLRPSEATVTTQTNEQYFGDVLAFERDSIGNIYVVASMGYISGGNPVTLTPRFENADGSEFQTDNSFAGATFFVGKLNRDLQWQWVTAPSAFESDFLTPRQGADSVPFYQIPLSFSQDENVLYIGGLVNDGHIIVQNRSSQSAVSATFSTGENTAASFIAGIEVSSGAWLDLEGLTVESEFGGDLIVPAVGSVQIVNGESVTVSAPRLYYINAVGDILFDTSDDSLLNREEDGNDVRAVTRYRCTGIEINGIRQSTDSCDTTFIFREKTDIKFNWQVEHLLNIENDFQNKEISNAVPAPEPLAGRHWLVEGQSSTLTVDGVVSQLGNSEQRELLYALDIEGQGASAPFFRAGEVLPLEADNDVFKTENFDVSLVKDDFKVEFWAYISSTQENGRLFTVYSDNYAFIEGVFSREQIYVDFDALGGLAFNVENNGVTSTFPISDISVSLDRWVHYSFTFDFQGEIANDESPAQRFLETLKIKTEVNITNAERATDVQSLSIEREVRLRGQLATLDIGRTNVPIGTNPTNIDMRIDDVRIWRKVNGTYPEARIDRPIEEEDLEETEGLLAYFNFDDIPKTDRDALTVPDIAENWVAGLVENYTALSESTLPAVELVPGNQRQQPLSFIASQPVSVTYLWKTQFTVNTNVNNSAYESAPSVLVNSVSRENVSSSAVFSGTGEQWIDFRSDVSLLVPANLDLGALDGYINATGLPSKFPQNIGAVANLDTVCFDGLTITDFNGSTCPTYYNLQINSFAEPLGIQWSYNVLTLEVELSLGESISLRRIIAPDPNNEPLSGTVNGDLLQDLLLEDRLEENAATGSVVSGPSGSTLNDMVFFSELEREFYALRPGLTSLEFAVNNTSNPLARRIFRVEVTAVWPARSDYTYVIDTPAVQLDRSSTDFWAYADLAYTEVDAENIIQANSFSYKSQDNRNPDDGSEAGKRSLLLFTCTQKDLPTGTTPAVASGNINNEPLCPRTVVLQSVESVTSVGAQEWDIGSEIVDDTRHTAPHSGYVFNSLARYNRNVYQPELLKGPIFPVNQQFVGQQEHDLVVVWYRNRNSAQIAETGVSEPVYWPTSAIKYDTKWPQSRTGNRIVVASQLGSEGVQFDGATQQLLFGADSVTDVSIYNQPDPMLAGYNPNEEHALINGSVIDTNAQIRPAAFALRNDLNILAQNESYTSSPYVLVQYRDLLSGQSDDWRMLVYEVQLSDQFTPHAEEMTPATSTDNYSFEYTMKAGEPVTALYPLNIVQGIQIPEQNWGHQGASPTQNVYWQDFEGKAYAISGDARLFTYQWYPMREDFWWPENQKICYNIETPTQTQAREYEFARDGEDCYGVSTGSLLPLGEAIPGGTPFREIELTYNTQWPEDLPTLKAGETLTFSGGENSRDDATEPGLNGVVAFKTGELIFDSSNPTYGIRLPASTSSSVFAAQLAQVLEKREVSLLATGDDEDEVRETNDAVNTSISLWLADGLLSVGRDGFYYFTDLPASLQTRIYIDNVNSRLGFVGLLNNKGISESSLTAAPGGGSYTLRPNILSDSDFMSLVDLCSELACPDHIVGVIDALKNKTRRPHQTCSTGILPGNTLGQDNESTFPFTPGLCESDSEMRHGRVFGPGLALIPNDGLLSEDNSLPNEIYVTLAENNDPDAGGPVTLPIIKIEREQKFRGEIVVLKPSNVFDEKSVLRHTADFGASGEDIVYDWYYRLDDGATTTSSSLPASNGWTFFGPGQAEDRLGLNEISLEGNAAALLADNLFYVRYRHKDCPADDETCYSDWAGASNNNPSENVYQPQLVQGWVKRIVDRVNAFEARISDFYNADAPATYVSMIQQAGQAYNGPIALNADQNVIENVGLIQLYETVLQRALSLSIDASQPFANDAIYTTLQLASSRLAQLYTLLGNEAYVDGLDPTIGFDTESGEYGSLAPSIYSFENQLPSLLEEELSLLRGRNRRGAAPSFNRLVWNFTIGEGEVAYAQNYNISDVDTSGFVDLDDAQQLFPQGHGDAWGHYSKALRYYYDLVKNPNFNWVPAGENVAVGGQVIEVDFNDEQRFAEMAAAKAKTGFDVVGLTYRQYYVEDTSGQWQGYKDRDTQRAWGVTEWAQRATTGAYFDWALANAILPEETASDDTDDLFNISRATVPEVEEIAAQAEAIYAMLDDADSGKNPLGLLPGVVPFDIDPVLLDRNSTIAATHFEQIADRAEQALGNAFRVFDFANQQKNRIREVANTAESLLEQAIDQDIDFKNRLIEIYGAPHEGNIGSGKAYPAGYDGPDTIFWAYIDTIDIINENVGDGYKSDVDKDTFEGAFESFMLPQPTNISSADVNSENLDAFVELVGNDSNISNQELTLSFPQDASNWGFVKPTEWGERRASGRLQQALIELVKAEADLSLGVIDYHGVAYDLNNAITDIQAYNDLNLELQVIRNNNRDNVKETNSFIADTLSAASFAANAVDTSRDLRDALVESFPSVSGTSNDTTFVARSSITLGYSAITAGLSATVASLESAAFNAESEGEIDAAQFEIEIANAEADYELGQKLRDAERILADEEAARFVMFKARETMRQAADKVRSIMAEGLRLQEQREIFNKRLAAKIQGERYKDMTFRIGQYDALQKYRAAFNLAARYTYLAASVYDYETNLAETDPRSSLAYMTQIVKERVLGEQATAGAVTGAGGLSELLSTMQLNFDTLKTQMGFNNPQTETGRFSLRFELARNSDDESRIDSDEQWRNWLAKHRVDNLWDVPEYRRFARNFAAERDGPQPALVIPFPTIIKAGRNFFNFPLAGGDNAYDPTNFATKVRSVGLWFENYNNANLAQSPRVYLLPTGNDVMYVPTSGDLDRREWQVVDQRIPVPFPLTSSSLEDRDFIPVEDTLVGDYGETRRHSSFRAYHDGGDFDENEAVFDSRLIGRSVWNTNWVLIIPGQTLLADSEEGLDTFIYGKDTPSNDVSEQGQKDGNGISDIKLFFQTYSYSGN